MTEVNVSARISEELEKHLESYMKEEHLERSSAVRRLLFKSLKDWRLEYALKLLEDGRTTVSKGAEIAGMDIWSFVAKIKESKVIWVKSDVVKDDIEAFR